MMRRQLLRLAGTLLCSPVLVRAANTGLTGPVRKRILATIEQAVPRVLNVQHLALIRRFHSATSSRRQPDGHARARQGTAGTASRDHAGHTGVRAACGLDAQHCLASACLLAGVRDMASS